MIPQRRIEYGPHERHFLLLWHPGGDAPVPLVLFFHGGGFSQGEPENIPQEAAELCLERGMALASAAYRLRRHDVTQREIYEDGARALQTLRAHADELGLLPHPCGTYGGSAGGHIAGWLAYHEDIAAPESPDPILRESSRVTALGLLHTQPAPRDFCSICDLFGGELDESLLDATFGRYLREREEEQLRSVWFREPFMPEAFPNEEAYWSARQAYALEHNIFAQATESAVPTYLRLDPCLCAADLFDHAKSNPPEIDLHHPGLMLLLKYRLQQLGHRPTCGTTNEDLFDFFKTQLSP
ncbi:MAG: alpha/beta hydrolase [Planctomycetota bacterium]|jgi:hypothetical protein